MIQKENIAKELQNELPTIINILENGYNCQLVQTKRAKHLRVYSVSQQRVDLIHPLHKD